MRALAGALPRVGIGRELVEREKPIRLDTMRWGVENWAPLAKISIEQFEFEGLRKGREANLREPVPDE